MSGISSFAGSFDSKLRRRRVLDARLPHRMFGGVPNNGSAKSLRGRFAHLAFGALFAYPALAACGNVVQSLGPMRASGAAVREAAMASLQTPPAARPDADSATLYVSSPGQNTITEYALPGDKVIRTIDASDGLNDPVGMFVSHGYLYVASGYQVLVFPPGATMPSQTIQDEVGAPYAQDVAIASDRTLYVVNYEEDYSNYGDIVVYAPGQSSPSYIIVLPAVVGLSATVDAKGDMYAGYISLSGPGRISKFKPGSRKGEDTHWPIDSPNGMAFDKHGNMVVAGNTQVYVFAPGVSKPLRTFGSLVQGGFLAFDHTGASVYVADSGNDRVDKFDYATGNLLKTIDLTGTQGIAIDPPAKP